MCSESVVTGAVIAEAISCLRSARAAVACAAWMTGAEESALLVFCEPTIEAVEASAVAESSGDGPPPPTNGRTTTSTVAKIDARNAKRFTG
jgi:hypothetical protein